MTAAAYGWGMYQKDLPDSSLKTDQKVAFVDFGESCLKCSIVSFTKNSMKVLASTCDSTLGGRFVVYFYYCRFFFIFSLFIYCLFLFVFPSSHFSFFFPSDFDRCLATHFAVQIQKTYKIDVLSNKRALVRLLQGCEKVFICLFILFFPFFLSSLLSYPFLFRPKRF